jgi:murein DD-endopeptidase MepM/ murein hydrolase activator NlpD
MNHLFPGLGGEWHKVDLAAEYAKRPDLDMWSIPDQLRLLDSLVPGAGHYTYGGFGEDRTKLWNNFGYPVPTLHLGVDFNNLPPGQPVASLSDGVVVDMWEHEAKFDGWGGRVVVRDPQGVHYMYGHLQPSSLPHPESIVGKGQIVGLIGGPTENGGWFPHLHLQIMTEEFIQAQPSRNWRLIDGYLPVMSAGLLDPMKVLESLN